MRSAAGEEKVRLTAFEWLTYYYPTIFLAWPSLAGPAVGLYRGEREFLWFLLMLPAALWHARRRRRQLRFHRVGSDVLVSSICHPGQRPSITSFGRNAENVRRVSAALALEESRPGEGR